MARSHHHYYEATKIANGPPLRPQSCLEEYSLDLASQAVTEAVNELQQGATNAVDSTRDLPMFD